MYLLRVACFHFDLGFDHSGLADFGIPQWLVVGYVLACEVRVGFGFTMMSDPEAMMELMDYCLENRGTSSFPDSFYIRVSWSSFIG